MAPRSPRKAPPPPAVQAQSEALDSNLLTDRSLECHARSLRSAGNSSRLAPMDDEDWVPGEEELGEEFDEEEYLRGGTTGALPPPAPPPAAAAAVVAPKFPGGASWHVMILALHGQVAACAMASCNP